MNKELQIILDEWIEIYYDGDGLMIMFRGDSIDVDRVRRIADFIASKLYGIDVKKLDAETKAYIDYVEEAGKEQSMAVVSFYYKVRNN